MFATTQPWEGPEGGGDPLVGEKWASLMSGVHTQYPLLLPGIVGAILLKLGGGGGNYPF